MDKKTVDVSNIKKEAVDSIAAAPSHYLSKQLNWPLEESSTDECIKMEHDPLVVWESSEESTANCKMQSKEHSDASYEETEISTLTENTDLKSENVVIKAKLMNGDYVLSKKRGRSKVWDTFARIECENGQELDGIVACKKCSNIYKFNKTTSNLVKHKCYMMNNRKKNICPNVEIDADTKKKGTQIVTEWVVRNGRSFNVINDSGVKKLAQFLVTVGANFGENINIDNLLPHPTTVSRNISQLYAFHVDDVKKDILRIQNIGYSLTSDIWTDNYLRTSYLSLTMHYITDGAMINRLLAVKSMKGDSCTGDKIKAKINKILREFGGNLETDCPIMVIDRGCNMKSAFRDLNQIHCVDHLLHSIIESTVKGVPELLDMVNQCSKLVKYFTTSGLNTTLPVSLKTYCPTRWNTVYNLLSSIKANWIDISNTLQAKNEFYRIQDIHLSNLSSIVNLLEPFNSCSKTLEGSTYATLHLAVPHINHLKKVCIIDNNDVEVVKKSKGMLSDLLKTVVMNNLSVFHNIALFLFPPTNKLSQFDEAEKKQTIDNCREVMKQFLNTTTINADLSVSKSVNSIFADYIQPCQNEAYDQMDIEIQCYKKVNISFSDEFNVLQWWDSNKDQFPILYKTSCKILSAPASRAASEKAFAVAKNLISDERCQLTQHDDMVNKIMFLHYNIENIDLNLLDV